MSPPFVSELEQDPFDGHEFIERIAWRATADNFDNPDKFDAKLLHNAFLHEISELRAIKDSSQKKCDRLEEICKEEEKRHWKNVRELKERFRQSISNFHSMDKRLDQVAEKVHSLGQQLEVINRPRSKAAEAHKLLKQFKQFLDSSYDPNVTFTPSNKRAFFEDADVIHKLYLISQELPKTNKRFERICEKIEQKYNLMERELIEEFVRAYRCDDRSQMKDIASIMFNFKGYNQCIDAFIEQSLMGVIIGNSPLDHRDGFSEVLPLCEKVQIIVREVFKNPEEVMSKLLLNIYSGKLKDHIVHTMKIHEQEKLNELYNQFTRTTKLSNQIIGAKIMGSKDLELLTRRIFAEHLSTYFKTELKTLRERCDGILNRYYESKNHQKRTNSISSFKDKITRAKNLSGLANINVNIGQLAGINITIANELLPPGETLLSEEVAISLLHEVKQALNRNKELSKPNEAENAVEIFDVCLQSLCVEHIDYAIELSTEMMNLEHKSQPDLRFFDIVRQCNAICHLIEKQFIDSVQPQVYKSESKRCYAECVKRKRQVLDQLETKLNEGLEKSLNVCINWIKSTLNAEQKKTDFEQARVVETTSACSKVCKFVNTITNKILDCLDGENINTVYTEFGIRFHEAICDHLKRFEFSSISAMVAISDVDAYRSAIAIPEQRDNSGKSLPDGKEVEEKFMELHSLCNLWVVPPENLKQLCCDNKQLSNVKPEVVDAFIKLRADSRTNRVMGHFREITDILKTK